ncbi:MAG: hypothetical protein ACRC2T_15225, partial [Thermoguttaceae bacterium]
MRFQINELRFSSQLFFDKSEADYAIRGARKQICIDGNLLADKFFTLMCEYSHGEFGIVIKGFDGIPPTVLVQDKCIFIGCGMKVICINIDLDCQLIEYDIMSPFVQFILIEQFMSVLAVHEIGIIAYDFRGQHKWEYISSDIIIDWSTSEKDVTLFTNDGLKISLDFKTGK